MFELAAPRLLSLTRTVDSNGDLSPCLCQCLPAIKSSSNDQAESGFQEYYKKPLSPTRAQVGLHPESLLAFGQCASCAIFGQRSPAASKSDRPGPSAFPPALPERLAPNGTGAASGMVSLMWGFAFLVVYVVCVVYAVLRLTWSGSISFTITRPCIRNGQRQGLLHTSRRTGTRRCQWRTRARRQCALASCAAPQPSRGLRSNRLLAKNETLSSQTRTSKRNTRSLPN